MVIKRCVLNVVEEANIKHIAEIRHLLSTTLSMCNINEKQHANMVLCFSEMVTNCIEHSQLITEFNMQLYSDSFGWWLECNDNGLSVDLIDEIPTPSEMAITSIFDLEKEGGRGIGLLHALADKFEVINQTASEEYRWNNGLRVGWQYSAKAQPPSILLVDDDPALIALYQAYLSQDFTIITASNGKEALACLLEQSIDLIISDITMPMMNGIQLRDALIAEQQTELIPFIFLTATNTSEIVEQTNGMGIDDYLCKPVDKTTLVQTINRVLTRSRRMIARLSERLDKKITGALLPKLPPEIPHWHIRMDTRNTGVGGGDLVLHHQTADSTFIIVVDVMGHNEAAKFFAYAYGGYIKGLLLALEDRMSPERLLHYLSQVVYDDALLSKLTLTCCAIELKQDGEVTIACAGHPPPLVLNAQGMRILPVHGILSGLLPITEYVSFTYHCAPHERLAVYTDGLLESAATPVLREQLEKTIFTTLQNTVNQPIEHSLISVFEQFDQLTNNSPIDDALLLLIEPI